jgi:hypothetical protein
VVATRDRALDFFTDFSRLCSPTYVLELDTVSAVSMDFWTSPFARLATSLVVAPFSFGRSSTRRPSICRCTFPVLHPAAVHRSWPIAEVRRMHERSQTHSDFDKFKGMNIERWQRVFMPKVVLERRRLWSPPLLTRNMSSESSGPFRVVRLGSMSWLEMAVPLPRFSWCGLLVRNLCLCSFGA